ncbi:hypothetical protein FB451DRAFT_1556472 [Mycena latifolia]|nr:hypothetical protein FB451DRAFT_1556472 [Mycena latifolia]
MPKIRQAMARHVAAGYTAPLQITDISTPRQLFVSWRIKLVTKSGWYGGLVALLTFASLTGSLVAHVAEFRKFSLVEAAITIWLMATAFAILFTTLLVHPSLLLSSHSLGEQDKTGFKTQTDAVADQIFFFTVQTGTLMNFASIADCVLFLIVPVRLPHFPLIPLIPRAAPETLMFIWDFSVSRLYSICLIATYVLSSLCLHFLLPNTDAHTGSTRGTDDLPRHGPGAPADAVARRIRGEAMHARATLARDRTLWLICTELGTETGIHHLQLCIPSNFASVSSPSVGPCPRRRTPRAEWFPRPLPTPALHAPTNPRRAAPVREGLGWGERGEAGGVGALDGAVAKRKLTVWCGPTPPHPHPHLASLRASVSRHCAPPPPCRAPGPVRSDAGHFLAHTPARSLELEGVTHCAYLYSTCHPTRSMSDEDQAYNRSLFNPHLFDSWIGSASTIPSYIVDP